MLKKNLDFICHFRISLLSLPFPFLIMCNDWTKCSCSTNDIYVFYLSCKEGLNTKFDNDYERIMTQCRHTEVPHSIHVIYTRTSPHPHPPTPTPNPHHTLYVTGLSKVCTNIHIHHICRHERNKCYLP